jgi:membrane-associated protein
MYNLQEIIFAFGYIGIFITIFAESGFLLGFFLPGDSLLFTLGLLSSQGIFNIGILIPLTICAAILGDSFGYYVGHHFGPRIFNREDSWFFKKKYLEETELFFKKHGKKTIILARFVPIVRTFAPIFAGVGNMEYAVFLAYNIVGGIIWAGGFLSIAFFLGKKIPGIEHYLEYIIIGIILASVIPIAIQMGRRYFKKQ